jgi:hypothetical protein
MGCLPIGRTGIGNWFDAGATAWAALADQGVNPLNMLQLAFAGGYLTTEHPRKTRLRASYCEIFLLGSPKTHKRTETGVCRAALVQAVFKMRAVVVSERPIPQAFGYAQCTTWPASSKSARIYSKLKLSNICNHLRLAVKAVVSDEKVRCSR